MCFSIALTALAGAMPMPEPDPRCQVPGPELEARRIDVEERLVNLKSSHRAIQAELARRAEQEKP